MKTGNRWAGAALLVAIVAGFLGGCASVPKVEMTKETAARVKRVALLGVVEPAQVEVANLGGAASAFGIVGGLVQGASNASNAKEFTALAKAQNVSFADALLTSMEQALKASGYEVVQARDQRPSSVRTARATISARCRRRRTRCSRSGSACSVTCPSRCRCVTSRGW